MSLDSIPEEGRLLVVKIVESDEYRTAAKYIPVTYAGAVVAGTFKFFNGTGVHLYRNGDCAVTHYLYVDEL